MMDSVYASYIHNDIASGTAVYYDNYNTLISTLQKKNKLSAIAHIKFECDKARDDIKLLAKRRVLSELCR